MQFFISPIKRIFLIVALFFLIFFIYYAYQSKGYPVGGEDNFSHFLYSKYAFSHPHLFLNLYGRPIFTIITSPFAGLGIFFVEVLNIIIIIAGAFITFLIAEELNFKHPFIVGLTYILIPYSFLTGISVLTEPLGALLLSLSLFFYFKKKYLTSSIVTSFMPFVRPEGIIFLIIYLVFWIRRKKILYIFSLFSGIVIFQIFGSIIFKDFFWLVNTNPNLVNVLKYPVHESLLFYFIDLPIFLNPVLAFFFIAGAFHIVSKAKFSKQLSIITLLFLVYPLIHILFFSLTQYFNIFGATANLRYLASILPVISIITAKGFEYYSFSKHRIRILITFLIWLFLLIQSINREMILLSVFFVILIIINLHINRQKFKDITVAAVLVIFALFYIFSTYNIPFGLDRQQKMITEVSEWIKSNKLDNRRLIHAYPYLDYILEKDPFNEDNILHLRLFSRAAIGDVLIWDSYFGQRDYQISKQTFQTNQFRLLKSFPSKINNDNFEVNIYMKR